MFYFADSFEEVREYLEANPRLAPNSCIVTNDLNFLLMEWDFNEGNIHYALFDSVDQLEQGWVRIVDIEGLEGETAVIDALFPGNGFSENREHLNNMYERLEDLAGFIPEETEYDELYLNQERSGVRRWLEWLGDNRRCRYGIYEVKLLIPEKNILSHFESGIDVYSVVNLMEIFNQK